MRHRNTSGFEALLYPTVNREGRETAVAIVRATFELNRGGHLEPADEQVPVRLEDVYFADPGESSSLEESDLAIYKPGTDVVVVGDAYAPGGQPTATVQVGVRVGGLHKSATVIGDRVFRPAFGVGPLAPSAPTPFTTIPLVWERTFGGTDPATANHERPRFDPRNPVGCGFGTPVVGQRLPNVYPLQGSGSERIAPEPWGFSPVGRSWLQRHRFAGTYDEIWRAERMPFLPVDFDYRFFQCAPSGLMGTQHLRGDEPVRIVNMSPEGELSFKLPGLVMGLYIRTDKQGAQRCLAALDTVVLEPARRRVALVWRRAIACRRSANEILGVLSFALSQRGARAAIGPCADAPVGEPTWIS